MAEDSSSQLKSDSNIMKGPLEENNIIGNITEKHDVEVGSELVTTEQKSWEDTKELLTESEASKTNKEKHAPRDSSEQEVINKKVIQQIETQNTVMTNDDQQEGQKTAILLNTSNIEETNSLHQKLEIDSQSVPSQCVHKTDENIKLVEVSNTGKIISNTLIESVKKFDISEQNSTSRNESEVIVRKESESLKNLLVYSDDDSEDDADEYKNVECNQKLDQKATDKQKIQVVVSSSSESDSESDSVTSVNSDDSDESNESEIEVCSTTKPTPKKNNKISEEMFDPQCLLATDLSKLEIDYEKEEFAHIGEISGIIETIVTVTTISGTPVYDLGSILFTDDNSCKKPLGEIYDVIGPVFAPVYCIGFKSSKEIEERGIKLKMKVYSAPKSNLSHYVFLKQLLEAKHTDASGSSDNEFSSDAEMHDSDDEKLTRKRKNPMQLLGNGNENSRNPNVPFPTQAYPNRGKHTKNRCFNTKIHNMQSRSIGDQPGGAYQTSNAPNFTGVPGPFNPSVPPPVYQNNTRWNTPSTMGQPQYWQGAPRTAYMRASPPPWNGNPRFNGIPNVPPPSNWNSCPRLGFPPNMRPPPNMHIPPPHEGPRWSAPTTDPAHSNRHFRFSHPVNSHPPHWRPRGNAQQPFRHGLFSNNLTEFSQNQVSKNSTNDVP
ncbi:hypothetical protein JTB14_016210 [Gonioctena quinquepunctata]|nr:hypothetical protein JTB14_016210 [Gonioctena quinquepunctata]